MAFIVEDGTGLLNANSYATVEYADVYFVERNVSAWSDLFSNVKQSALIKATDYIEMRYTTKFKDSKLFPDVQALSFPRTGVVAIPTNLLKATCEYALRASVGELTPDIAVSNPVNTRVLKRIEGAVTTETETSYPTNYQGQATYPKIQAADGLIQPLLRTSQGALIRS